MEDVKLEYPDSGSGRNHGISERSSKRPHLETSNTPKKEKINRTSSRDWKKAEIVEQSVRRRRNALSIHIDGTFEAFLNQSKVSGDQMIYAPRNGTRNIYEEDMQSSSDSERTVLDNNRRNGCRPSSVKTKAATGRSFSKGVMKRKMSCPKSYEDTYSHPSLNAQDCHQDNRYRASFVKRKTPTEELEDLRAQKCSAAKKKKNNNKKEAVNSVCAELDLANESYEAFISFTDVDGKKIMYTPSNGGRRIYEEVETEELKTTSDAETNAMHRDPLDNIHTMDTDGEHGIESHNQFREGLVEDLRRPYNLDEHLNLLEDALKQGPSDHEIDLFNEMEPPPREYGNPYLVVYKDLSEKINAANGDRSRILNLLRGLFYWLKNKSQEGSFIPWKDKTCLKVIQPEIK